MEKETVQLANTAPFYDAAAPDRAPTSERIELSKRWLRSEIWKRMLIKKCDMGDVLYCTPSFLGSDKAAALLFGTEEFKKAQTIQVHLDNVLEIVKLKTLLAGKTLFLPGARDSNAVLLRVDLPEIDLIDTPAESLRLRQVALDNKVKLEMVVIGSVMVSRDGYRIGQGMDLVDLHIGLLVEIGCITADTIIATMVHDEQVVDKLPANLFQKYDTPVDLIVTPTAVIRVAERLPRPSGIFWELLSARRLRLMPVLQNLKERVEQIARDNGGHANIMLKEPDTDSEETLLNNKKPNGDSTRRQFRRRQQPSVEAVLNFIDVEAKKKEVCTVSIQPYK